jgi:hypothetical protein
MSSFKFQRPTRLEAAYKFTIPIKIAFKTQTQLRDATEQGKIRPQEKAKA